MPKVERSARPHPKDRIKFRKKVLAIYWEKLCEIKQEQKELLDPLKADLETAKKSPDVLALQTEYDNTQTEIRRLERKAAELSDQITRLLEPQYKAMKEQELAIIRQGDKRSLLRSKTNAALREVGCQMITDWITVENSLRQHFQLKAAKAKGGRVHAS